MAKACCGLAGISALLFLASMPLSGGEGAGTAVRIMRAAGKVTVFKAIRERRPAEKFAATQGLNLESGDTVRTDADGSCNLEMPKGTMVAIGANSGVEVRRAPAKDGNAETVFRLPGGRFHFLVARDEAPLIRIETTAGVIRPDAAEFIVSHDPPTAEQRRGVTIVTVLHGAVNVARAAAGPWTELGQSGKRAILSEAPGMPAEGNRPGEVGTRLGEIRTSLLDPHELARERDAAPQFFLGADGGVIPPARVAEVLPPSQRPRLSFVETTLDPRPPEKRVDDGSPGLFIPGYSPPPKPPPVSP
ncbi:MAG: FecR family protein [Planctomycetota bacterium]|nr:FecR family protein [Planctomycetota bacterium]